MPKAIARKKRTKLVFISLGVLTLLLVAYVLIDSLRSEPEISQVPAESSTLGSQVERQVFNEEEFRFVTDNTWKKIPSLDGDYKNYRYQSESAGLVRRQLAIYVDSMPEEFPVSHILPIEVEDNRITPLVVSPKCSELQKNKKNRRDVQMTWAGVDFLCDPDSGLVLVGTSHNKSGYLTQVKGSDSGTHSYFFIYRDDEPTPRLNVLPTILETFEAK